MRVLLVLLITALVVKDIYLVSDRHLLRGTTQGLCFLVGVLWFVKHGVRGRPGRYWPLLGYLTAVSLATIGTREPGHVLFQVVSLTAVLVFAVALFESGIHTREGVRHTLIATSIVVLFAAVCLSLMTLVLHREQAYDSVGQFRFRGAFGRPAGAGVAAGLLVCMSAFWFRRPWVKAIPVLLGSICVALTMSRTFWIATALSVCATAWLYYRWSRGWILAAAAVALLGWTISSAFDLRPDSRAVGRIVRVESVAHLSGRLETWRQAWNHFQARPFLGHGFTVGSDWQYWRYKRGSNRKSTVDGGYVQSLVDVGLLGTAFYLCVIFVSVTRLYMLDRTRSFPVEFCVLLFLIIANFAENIIFSGSLFYSVLFWFFATFSLSLKGSEPSPVTPTSQCQLGPV